MEEISKKKEEINLPVLDGIIDFLNKFVPFKLMQKHLTYDFQKTKEENKTIDLSVLTGKVKRSLIGIHPEDEDYIKRLIDERDVYNIHNTPSGKENLFIQYYNKKVIETLEFYWSYIIDSFSFHPDFEKSGKGEVNMGMVKPIFKLWYDVFDTNENGQTSITMLTKGIQTKQSRDFLNNANIAGNITQADLISIMQKMTSNIEAKFFDYKRRFAITVDSHEKTLQIICHNIISFNLKNLKGKSIGEINGASLRSQITNSEIKELLNDYTIFLKDIVLEKHSVTDYFDVWAFTKNVFVNLNSFLGRYGARIYIEYYKTIQEWKKDEELKHNIEYLNNLDQIHNRNVNNDMNLVSLSEIFNENNNAFEICKELMDELDLTIGGMPNPDLKKGRAGTLIGLIKAIILTPGMLSMEKPKGIELLKYFNSYLNTSYKTFDNRSKDCEINFPIARDFIKRKLKK